MSAVASEPNNMLDDSLEIYLRNNWLYIGNNETIIWLIDLLIETSINFDER